MLKNSLKDIAHIVLLRSDKILYELLRSSQEDLLQKSSVYRDGVEDFYPNSFRKGTMLHSMEYALDSDASHFTLLNQYDFLEKLFDEYMTKDGSFIYAKYEMLQEYSSLLTKLHPFNIVGYELAKRYEDREISLHNIKEYVKYITPLALNIDRDYKEYAENHIHLGGSPEIALNFFALLMQPKHPQEYYEKLPRINEFSYINNKMMNLSNLIEIAKYCVSVINTKLLFLDTTSTKIDQDLHNLLNYEDHSLVDVDFCSFGFVQESKKEGFKVKDPLMRLFYEHLSKGYTNKAWLVLNIVLFHTHKTTKDTALQKVIAIFLHITNILRSYMVMSQNLGLSHFSEFSGSRLRKQERHRHQNIASNIIANGTTKVEAKLTSSAIFSDEIVEYKLALDKEIIAKELNSIENNSQKYFLNTNYAKRAYHFSIHFIRKDEIKSKQVSSLKQHRFAHLRKQLKEEAKRLNHYLYGADTIVSKFEFYRKFHSRLEDVLAHEEELKKEYIDMSKLIVSIDVAGDENRTPPEVFAPIFKFLRREHKKQEPFIEDYLHHTHKGHHFMQQHRLRLSVHAGEDFNHIVTGMRRVHESVKFYDMQNRDRLGHALAIGINPKEWCELNGDIFLTKQEHLDNLVWLYHQAIEVQPYYNGAVKLMFKYEKNIKELSKEIYDKEYSLDNLYKAWKLREFCPQDSFQDKAYKIDDEYFSAIEFSKDDSIYEEARDIYDRYHFDTDVFKRGNKVVKIDYNNHPDGSLLYVVTDEDLELLEAVQDRLIQKFAKKGIIIETNPSSNTFIAHIHAFEKHPIFRWNPIEESMLEDGAKYNKFGIRTSRMRVCINTDDPAIMPTTLRNEFALLNKVAFDANHSQNREKIMQWSENIRHLGLEIFEYDHKASEFCEVR
jgi:hypothetical protein